MVTPRKRATAAAKAHLDTLKAAGVDHLPARAALPPDAPVEASAALPAVETPPLAQMGPGAVEPVARKTAALTAPGSLFDEAVAAEVPTSPEERRQALTLLDENEVKGCPKCPELYATRTQTVFGVGPLSPDICFIGEAPGEEEDRTGEPFVGVSGQLMMRILQAMGLTRQEVYIANILKCRPPMNRNPAPDECANCRPYLERQLELVQPKFICCLGGVSAQYLLKTKLGITKLRGQWHSYKGTPVICTFHPAALLRNPDWKKDTWDDMKTLLRKMGRPIPGGR